MTDRDITSQCMISQDFYNYIFISIMSNFVKPHNTSLNGSCTKSELHPFRIDVEFASPVLHWRTRSVWSVWRSLGSTLCLSARGAVTTQSRVHLSFAALGSRVLQAFSSTGRSKNCALPGSKLVHLCQLKTNTLISTNELTHKCKHTFIIKMVEGQSNTLILQDVYPFDRG